MRQPLSLTDEERQHLQVFVHQGKANARTLTRARVLLKVAEGWNDQDIVAAFDICLSTVTNVCKRYTPFPLSQADRSALITSTNGVALAIPSY